MLCGWLTGCGRPPAAPAPGYVNVDALLKVHPRGQELDTLAQRLRTAEGDTPPLDLPAEVYLPQSASPPAGLEPPVDALDARARQRAQEDVRPYEEIARVRAEAEFNRRLAALRREVRSRQEEPQDTSLAPYAQIARQRAEELGQLRAQLQALRPRENDPLFYSPAQLRRRQDLYAELDRELRALEERRRAELQALLDRPPPKVATVPPEPIAALEKERDATIARELAHWDAEVRAATQRAAGQIPPPLAPPQAAAAPERVGDEPREQMAERVREAAVTRQRQRTFQKDVTQVAANRLRTERERLEQLLRGEIESVARSAARARGRQAVFTPRRGIPDITDVIRGDVRNHFAASDPAPRPRRTAGRSGT